ncbi:uncharacterized protein L199_001694 [Kwoniella botswanensis]|uniref:uncharacterized protein n=1 Tax=Kwoniella botswanensis TaxID=1268659 RepID=UPI00315E0082
MSTISFAKSKKEMSAVPLSPEILRIIFIFCSSSDHGVAFHIVKQEDKLRSQKALYACLRVNKTWYMAATPLLYRAPIFQNIASFFCGIDRYLSSTIDVGTGSTSFEGPKGIYSQMIDQGNTKLPLLQYVQRLQIIPLIIPDEYEGRDYDSVIRNAQQATFELGCKLLNDSPFRPHLLPKLDGITIGSQEVFVLEDEEFIMEAFDQGIKVLKGMMTPLVKRCICHHVPPREYGWGYYQNRTSADYEVDNGIDYDNLPERIETHTGLAEGIPPIIWGTTNVISIRTELDTDQNSWPRWTSSRYHEENNELLMNELWQFQRSASGHSNRDHNQWDMVYDLVHAIRESRMKSKATPVEDREECMSMRKLDERTKIHFYGLEKLFECYDLTYELSRDIISRNRVMREDKKEDLSSWHTFSHSRFNQTILNMREREQKDVLKYMDEETKHKLNIDDDGKWLRHKRKYGKLRVAPEIKFSLSVDYDGCGSCGDEKGDGWSVKQTRTPESMVPVINWDAERYLEDYYMEVMLGF